MSNSKDYVNTEKKIILIWSPKVACTTLHDWFIKDICDIKLNKDPRIIAKNRKISRHIYNYNPFNNYNIYFFIRNPILRCISCYINKFVNYKGRKLNSLLSLEAFSINLIRNYNPELIKNYTGITFNEFLDAIEHGIKMNNIDHHFNNQVNKNKFESLKNNKKINFEIIDIHDLNVELNKINNLYTIPERNYQKLNTSSYHLDHIFCDITNIKSIDLNDDQISIKNFKHSFNRIKEVYSLDFEYLEMYLRS